MMRPLLPGLLCGLLLVWGCDQPDEVYQPNPSDFDPEISNGFAPVGIHFSGEKGFDDPTLEYIPTLPTIEVCSDGEISDRQSWMVRQPITPMVGAGGLDMTGGEEWAGLTIDEAQSPDMLCQALYYADGIAAWGDYYEFIAYWDTQTRKIDSMMMRPGYLGVIEAGEFTFEVNEPIMRGNTPLSRNDGSDRDPKTDDNMRDIDRALIDTFRPELDSSQIDCVEAGSCYIISSGTLPVLVFMSVEIYLPLEPTQQRLIDIEMALKRPFRIGTGEATVDGYIPTIFGTAAAGIPDCEVTFGTPWQHIDNNCLADDPMAMAEIRTINGYEQLVVTLGGTLLYFDRPSLAIDEILPFESDMENDDTVAILSLNAAYEGNFSMPYSDILEIFKANLEVAVRAEVPSLAPEDQTGVELLRTPNDAGLPAYVVDRYPDRLRPGGIYAAFCEDDGPDGDDEFDSCIEDASGRPVLPLTATLRGLVTNALGADVTPKLTDPSFYVQQFLIAMAEHFNGGTVHPDQVNLSPSASRPDRIYATITLFTDTGTNMINVYYGGNDDRIHFMNFQEGINRMEAVLLRDAELPTATDPAPSGVFTLQHLLGSPRLGLGAIDTVTVEEVHPDTRRAILNITMGSTETVEVLAPYQEPSNVSGYWVPVAGPQSLFQPSVFFELYGGTFDAAFYMLPVEEGSPEMEITAIAGIDFFGDVTFCGFNARIGDYADEILERVQDADYPCEMIVRRSENREFITSMSDLDGQVKLNVANNMITDVFVWAR